MVIPLDLQPGLFAMDWTQHEKALFSQNDIALLHHFPCHRSAESAEPAPLYCFRVMLVFLVFRMILTLETLCFVFFCLIFFHSSLFLNAPHSFSSPYFLISFYIAICLRL